MAQGLPMCHIFQVLGSSLPVSISIERWADHINLQAEVKVSGIKVCSHRCHIFQVVGSLIPHPHIDAWEADQIKQQAMTVIIALKALQNAVTNMADDRKAEA